MGGGGGGGEMVGGEGVERILYCPVGRSVRYGMNAVATRVVVWGKRSAVRSQRDNTNVRRAYEGIGAPCSRAFARRRSTGPTGPRELNRVDERASGWPIGRRELCGSSLLALQNGDSTGIGAGWRDPRGVWYMVQLPYGVMCYSYSPTIHLLYSTVLV